MARNPSKALLIRGLCLIGVHYFTNYVNLKLHLYLCSIMCLCDECKIVILVCLLNNRGYYRCSSSKGCLARKQVERNRSDPGIFIVTYTGEHNHPAPTHRNSLAGSTRQKPVTPQGQAATATTTTTTTSDSNKHPSSDKPTVSSSSPTTSLEVEEEIVPESTNTESRELELDMLEDEDEEEDLGFSDVGISDDFFVGLEGFVSGENFPDNFPANFGLPWVANSTATAAGGI